MKWGEVVSYRAKPGPIEWYMQIVGYAHKC